MYLLPSAPRSNIPHIKDSQPGHSSRTTFGVCMCVTACVWEGDQERGGIQSQQEAPAEGHFTDKAVFNLTQNPNSSTALWR